MGWLWTHLDLAQHAPSLSAEQVLAPAWQSGAWCCARVSWHCPSRRARISRVLASGGLARARCSHAAHHNTDSPHVRAPLQLARVAPHLGAAACGTPKQSPVSPQGPLLGAEPLAILQRPARARSVAGARTGAGRCQPFGRGETRQPHRRTFACFFPCRGAGHVQAPFCAWRRRARADGSFALTHAGRRGKPVHGRLRSLALCAVGGRKGVRPCARPALGEACP